MRRLSVLLGLAALIIAAVVGYTYSKRQHDTAHRIPPPLLNPNYEASGGKGWIYRKSDPITHQPIVLAEMDVYERVKEPSTSRVGGLRLRLYNKSGKTYTYVESAHATFDEASGVMTSDDEVSIMMSVPADKEPNDKAATAKLMRIKGSGVRYETKTGKATSDKPAQFQFANGNGSAVGVEYDPAKKELHLKSAVSLNWVGEGPSTKMMHIETQDLLYKEAEQKVYLSPWARLKRDTMTVDAKNTLVTIQDKVLHQIDADFGSGVQLQGARKTEFSADKLITFFDEDGAITNIVGDNHAHIVATDPSARTTVNSQRGEMHFLVEDEEKAGKTKPESILEAVQADGGAVVESVPLPRPNVQIGETRILRSEHLWMDMKPGGQEIREIRTSSAASLEFKPNRPDQSHRTLDASRLVINYGDDNTIDTLHAWKVTTHTDRPAKLNLIKEVKDSAKDAKAKKPPAPAVTSSDEMLAKFTPGTSQLAMIDQNGAFRYQEGDRQARAQRAHLNQVTNQITLIDSARVWDDTGSTTADQIFLNQTDGDMDATGHVSSTRVPDQSAANGSSLLDDSKPMQARADKMQTRDKNLTIHYDGHAVVWQGGNRTSANRIDIDRDEGTFHAAGNVVSELVDQKKQSGAAGDAPDPKTADPKATDPKVADAKSKSQTDPKNGAPTATSTPSSAADMIYTVVRAPELLYDDDKKIAHYTGGVKLTRDRMTVSAKELQAYLRDNKDKKSDESSLERAVADGSVVVNEVAFDHTRNGTGEHAEFYTSDNRVVLNGGIAQMVDSRRGTTRGNQLTYYSDDDRLFVEGEKKALVSTHMKKK
jgi:lipopolysaccharide export system protein LptA